MPSIPYPQSLPTKVCTKCAKPLPPSCYYRDSRGKERLFSWCKACFNAHNKARCHANRVANGLIVNRRLLKKPVQTEKRCARCGLVKPAAEFPIRGDRRHRLRSFCTACKNAQKAEYKERNRDKVRQSDARYRAENKERLAEGQRTWRAAHPTEYRAIHGGWKRRNVSACRAMAHRRHARLHANGGSWTAAEWEALKARYDYTCLMCKRREPEIVLHFDHVKPISQGGLNDISNGQPLCRSCNSRKHVKILDLRPF